MSAEVLASPPPGWTEWVVATKSGSPKWVMATKLLKRDVRRSAVIESLDAMRLRLSDDELRRQTDAGALTAMFDRETHQPARQG
jgi:hypothetical protein